VLVDEPVEADEKAVAGAAGEVPERDPGLLGRDRQHRVRPGPLGVVQSQAKPVEVAAPIDEVVEDGRMLARLLLEFADRTGLVAALTTPEDLVAGRRVGVSRRRGGQSGKDQQSQGCEPASGHAGRG
jgi:hypothetical protein